MLYLSSGGSDIPNVRYFFCKYSILGDSNTYVYDSNTCIAAK